MELLGLHVAIITAIVNLALFPSGVSALQCFQCGLYNDGVGSITPCINYTVEKHLKECPHKYCIKYVSEGSEVRECIDTCKEVENWGTRIYCCQDDGCNDASLPHVSAALAMFAFVLLVLH